MTLQSDTTLTAFEAAAQERRWVAKVRSGDEAAMTLLVERHRRRLLRVAGNVLRDSHEAEDAAQESFLKAFREIGKLRDDRAFSGYLYRICVRLCMDRLRSRRAEPAEFDQAVEARNRQVETKVVVDDLLSLLSPELRLTLVLREMEQFSYDEIAEVMNVPVGTVRSRLHAAREKFRKHWVEAVGEV
jgi:RNA polymerase sigma-70 factor (ECF subfamily)